MMLSKPVARLIQWVAALAIPICLIALNFSLVTGASFLHWEYRRPSFPADSFGLTTEERIGLAEVAFDYVTSGAELSLLADLRLPDGAPAFNPRELSHMADVQRVYQGLMVASLIAAGLVLAGVTILGMRGQAQPYLPNAMVSGSLITLGLLFVIGVTMALSWNAFFTGFHRVFFEGDTWLFEYSDTLIRMFPIRFFMDYAALVVGLLVAEAIALGGVGRLWARSASRRIGPSMA